MANIIGTRPFLVLAAGLMLAGCINFSALDNLKTAKPAGPPFRQALFKNYAFLAHSFGNMGQASYTSFDQNASIPLTKTNAAIARLANAYAEKALLLSRGDVVDPVASRDVQTHNLRVRLVRALRDGRDDFPRDAARAQADWDCWRLDSTVPSMAAAAEQCHKSFQVTLVRLEDEVKNAKAAAAAEKAAAAKKKEAAKAAAAKKPAGGAETP